MHPIAQSAVACIEVINKVGPYFFWKWGGLINFVAIRGTRRIKKNLTKKCKALQRACNERMHRHVFNDSKSAGLRPDRNDCELNVREEIQKVYTPKTR